MGREAVLARGRAAAERGMRDTCQIRREVTDPDSGAVVSTWSDVYTGRCRVQQRTPDGQPLDSGQDYVLLQRLEVQLPMSVVGLRVGDEITITASVDPDLVGRVIVVQDLPHKTDATARRVGVTDRTS
ncbi:DUF6093 family protein [Micromonospora sp. NBC_00421]|uniref:DUF6093 family protein n=1 Tax=Micromonospora sp. NBC_00421 TaxID=2975976 RepID=UPI002E234638